MSDIVNKVRYTAIHLSLFYTYSSALKDTASWTQLHSRVVYQMRFQFSRCCFTARVNAGFTGKQFMSESLVKPRNKGVLPLRIINPLTEVQDI